MENFVIKEEILHLEALANKQTLVVTKLMEDISGIDKFSNLILFLQCHMTYKMLMIAAMRSCIY